MELFSIWTDTIIKIKRLVSIIAIVLQTTINIIIRIGEKENPLSRLSSFRQVFHPTKPPPTIIIYSYIIIFIQNNNLIHRIIIFYI